MTRVATIKLVLIVSSVAVFLWGATNDLNWARWTGVGLLLAAWLLRFIERGERHPKRQGPSI